MLAGTDASVAGDNHSALHTTGEAGAAVNMIQQWAERCVGIQGGRAIGGGNDARLWSWAKTIAVRLGMLPDSRSGHSPPAHASDHSVRKYVCERREIEGLLRRVEQPSRQRVQGFQVQRLPGSAFSLVQMLSGTVNYRGTLSHSKASPFCKIAPSGVSKYGGMIPALTRGPLS